MTLPEVQFAKGINACCSIFLLRLKGESVIPGAKDGVIKSRNKIAFRSINRVSYNSKGRWMIIRPTQLAANFPTKYLDHRFKIQFFGILGN